MPTSERKTPPVALFATALLRRPALIPTALRVALLTAEPGWWHRVPFLPLPATAWFRFRMETAYGDGAAIPSKVEFVDYLAWCKRELIATRVPVK